MVAARYGQRHPDCPGVVNVDGHGAGGPSAPPALEARRQELIAHAPDPPSDSGDEAWLAEQLEAMRPMVEDIGLEWRAAEPGLRRSFVPVGDGTYQRRPSRRLVATFSPAGAELFDVYRSLTCPFLIYNCIAVRPNPFGEELYKAYLDSIATDLAALARDRANVTVATLDCGHFAFFERPTEMLGALLAFTARVT